VTAFNACRWLFAILLAIPCLLCTLGNLLSLAGTLFTKKTTSLIPLAGGIFGCFALIIIPIAAVARYFWLPLVADPGTILSVIGVIIISWRHRAPKRREHDDRGHVQ
jgi:hypothetical protein